MAAEFSIYYQILKTSNSKFKAFFQEILPQIKNKFINYMIFSLESNIR
ncbi:ABC-type phosphate/phosphonate transport system, permease component [Chlamydia abortus]|nr:ABC-type phosphate/phosphonate transport system, permease component [Chlamydia abortus]SGA31135.1 ABC-type phosphate/phosphonate transport system, permease component [Chlamydia abortus]SGA31158.1 ABC-type phosphate/phosphonate transport system, permease component [Chlamydia abortus]